MVSGPLMVRRPRLILRYIACVTIRLAGAFVYAGCSRSSSSPRNRASRGTGSTVRPRARPPGRLGVVVGVLRHPGEPHRGVGLDEVHHLGATVDVGVAAHLRHRVAHDGVEVALGVVQVVGLPGCLERVVARDPDAAAAARGRAAEVGALLDEDRVEALPSGREGSAHAGATSADDDHVHLGGQRRPSYHPSWHKTVTGSSIYLVTSQDAISAAVERLAVAQETRVPCAPVRDLIGTDDLAAAYAVQQGLVQRRLATGATVVGRKIGATSEAVQQPARGGPARLRLPAERHGRQ